MKLIIVRHGEAEPEGSGAERNLTPVGRRHIEGMTRVIVATGWNICEIRSSPVLRARQTAAIIKDNTGSADHAVMGEQHLAPGSDVNAMLELIDPTPNSDAAIWVFHAPDVIRLASSMTGMPESGFYFPPGTMLALNFDPRQARGHSMLCWTLQPSHVALMFP